MTRPKHFCHNRTDDATFRKKLVHGMGLGSGAEWGSAGPGRCDGKPCSGCPCCHHGPRRRAGTCGPGSRACPYTPQPGAPVPHQRGRYRLDAGLHRPGAADDAAGCGPVLRGYGAPQERAQHHGQCGGHRGAGYCAVVCCRVFVGLHPGKCLDRGHPAHVVQRAGLRQGRRAGGGEPCVAHHPRVGLGHVPAHLCHHHARAGGGCFCRAHQVLVHAVVHRPVVVGGVRPHRPLGLGAGRLAGQDGCAGLCRGLGGARQRRGGRAGLCLVPGPAQGLWAGGLRALQPGPDHGGCRLAVGGLVRLQRRLGRGC